MSKDISLTIEKFLDGEENKFLIKSPKEIQRILQTIAQKKSPAVLHFENEHCFFKTSLLAVTDKGIWIDVGPSEEENNHLLHSDDITLVTSHQGTKVQFVCQQPLLANYVSQPAFYFSSPPHILRLQRRDFFRLPTCADAPLKCIVPVNHKEHVNPHGTTIMNISVGGIALICKEDNVRLESGATYPDCRIELPGIGTLVVAIQVKNLFDVTSASGATIKHAGCEFIQPDGEMSIFLQRYVDIMQSKLSGLR